jgi:hypothetical protein
MAFHLKIDESVWVGFVAIRAFNDTLPLRALPLGMLRIVIEGRILIGEGFVAGLASYKPVLRHLEILSRIRTVALQLWNRYELGVITLERHQECLTSYPLRMSEFR